MKIQKKCRNGNPKKNAGMEILKKFRNGNPKKNVRMEILKRNPMKSMSLDKRLNCCQ